ncbi:anti-sigma B factor RsbW [Paenibacillus sp. strain BS8-2]
MSQSPIRLRIPAEADYLDIVRAALYAVAAKAGFAYEDIEDMKVAVTEACSNAILHAYKGSDDRGEVDIEFLSTDDSLMLTVRDYGGAAFDRVEPVTRTGLHGTPIEEAPVGGLGLFMMKALMDDVTVRINNGTEVVLTKRRSRNEEMV